MRKKSQQLLLSKTSCVKAKNIPQVVVSHRWAGEKKHETYFCGTKRCMDTTGDLKSSLKVTFHC
jgi:hypothetical protein